MEAVLLLILLSTSSALKLPSYISACSRNDPKLNECVVDKGNAAIPVFVHGDPNYGVPNLDPLAISKLAVQQGTRQVGLNLTLSDFNMIGMSNARLKNARVDFKNKQIEWEFINTKGLQLVGPYKVEGQVLLLPITGEGEANITITDLDIDFTFNYELYQKKGKDYLRVTTTDMKFDVGAATIKLDNLFNGDRLLGDNMNRFLNDNWKELVNEFGPEVGKALEEVFKKLITSVHSLVPFDVVFPE